MAHSILTARNQRHMAHSNDLERVCWEGHGMSRGTDTGDAHRRARSRTALLASTLVLAAALGVGCAHSPSAAPAPNSPADGVYISIGDSYAVGDEAAPGGGLTATQHGFADLITDRVAARGGPLRLLNFGCTGATSTDLLTRHGCGSGGQATDGSPYPTSTQAEAALAALRTHRNNIRLVTVVIGGNDVYGCLRPQEGGFSPDETQCVDHSLSVLRANLHDLLVQIRAIVRPDVPIVGLTYPDIFLGAWVAEDQASRSFATASVGLFRDELNPMLRDTYTEQRASFVDVTELTDGYGSLADTTELPPYGELPVPVARVCTLTSYCAVQDPHPTDEGYSVIADEVLRRVDLH
jgi:lysophospholipase L1-like esterase